MSEDNTVLTLPAAVRARLEFLLKVRQQADLALQGPVATAFEFLGLDPKLPHTVNFDTGVVTPFQQEPHGTDATKSSRARQEQEQGKKS